MPRKRTLVSLQKTPTGIQGLDEVSGGGLPTGRTTLVCGAAGCGKTLLGMEFLVRGAVDFNEPGVCLSFEERAEDLAVNVASLGFDLRDLITRKKLVVDTVQMDRSYIEETGEYDLEGLFVRLNHAIESIGAKRVLLDTIETLFAGLKNEFIIRSELRRLFHWLTERGVTAVVTGERGNGTLTRNGLEEYISDCVILLDHRVQDGIFTRRLRIVKYRGSVHGTNDYPFLIDERGISVLPVTSLGLRYPVSSERISTGIPGLDRMLGGRGFFRGSSVMLSGTAGTGKTTFAAHFAQAVCSDGRKCIFFAFEESPDQLIRNMRSVGIDLETCRKSGALLICAARPTMQGLESHLVAMHRAIVDFQPSAVVVDPITSLLSAGSQVDVTNTLLRLIDFIKQSGITAYMTHLTDAGRLPEATELSVSSLVDTWLLLRDLECAGERNRVAFILKSRGMDHSNQVQEFVMTKQGVVMPEAYLGGNGGLSGSARLAHEAREKQARAERQQEIARKQREVERKRRALEVQIDLLRSDLEADADELRMMLANEQERSTSMEQARELMARSRKIGNNENQPPASKRGKSR